MKKKTLDESFAGGTESESRSVELADEVVGRVNLVLQFLKQKDMQKYKIKLETKNINTRTRTCQFHFIESFSRSFFRTSGLMSV